MGNKWSVLPLEKIATVIDSRHKTPQYSDVGYPMVRVVDIKGGELSLVDTKNVTSDVYADFSKGRDPEIGDLIISRVGSYGNVSYVSSKQKFCLGQNTALIIPKDNDRFLYYALISPQLRRQIDNMAVGAVQKTISLKSIKSLEIPQPPAKKRAEIAIFLALLDDKITLNRQINQTLEQMAQALFKSWFVDFDPVVDNALDAGFFEQNSDLPVELLRRAEQRKAVRQQPDFKPLPAETRQLFPAAFEACQESSLGLGGWVPKGWEVRAISDIAFINKKSWAKNTAPENIKYVDLSNAKDGIILGVQEYSFEEAPSRARRVLNKRDTIFGMVRPANRSFAYVDRDGLTGSTGFVVISAKNKNASSFVYQKLTSDSVLDDLIRVADGAAYPAIKPDDISELMMAVPSKCILDFFERITDAYRERIAHNLLNNEQLANLRDTLLPKLIAGELRLNDNDLAADVDNND